MPKSVPLHENEATVILSGGQDSTTVLHWAKKYFKAVHAITFDYGQRHSIEINAAAKVAELAGVDSFEIIGIPDVMKSTSPLVDHSAEVGHYSRVDALPGGIENTFVPCRNMIFLTIAANRAKSFGSDVCLVTGVSQVDFGGYPDCRQKFIDLMAQTLSQAIFGTDDDVRIFAPLINFDKKQTVQMAQELGEACMEGLAYSHTCYDGEYPPNPYNHASLLRAKGFAAAGVADPLIARAKREGKLPAGYPDSGLVEGTEHDQQAPNVLTPLPETES